ARAEDEVKPLPSPVEVILELGLERGFNFLQQVVLEPQPVVEHPVARRHDTQHLQAVDRYRRSGLVMGAAAPAECTAEQRREPAGRLRERLAPTGAADPLRPGTKP